MNPIIVLSDTKQLEIFKKLEQRAEIMVYCDNEALYSALDKEGIVFEKLDEFLIRDQWAGINSWGCTKATGWLGLSRHLTPDGKPDVLPALFLHFACFLIAAVKNFLFAQYLIKKNPLLVYVFRNGIEPVFPSFSGNAFLNYFLRVLAAEKSPAIQILQLTPAKSVPTKGSSPLWTNVRRALGNILMALFTWFSPKTSQKHLIVYGSSRHLESVTSFLYGEGIPILIYDNEFHGQLFRYAVARRIPYVIASQLPALSSEDVKRQSKSLNDQLLAKFADAERLNHFRYKDHDFSDSIREVILPTLTKYFDRAAAEFFCCDELSKRISVAGCLVDEDFGARANFCEFFKSSGKEIFCISHAQGTYDFDAAPESRSFSQSMTFVNSEHEKIKMYGALGWDLSRVIVTGTPRYDRLFRIAKQSKPRSSFPRQILYCPGCLLLNTPDTPGFLGLDVYSYKMFQEMAFQSFVEATEGLPIEIIVKSHYDSDDAIWVHNVKNIKTKTPIKIYKHSADFHALLAQSHAMVLPSLSTSLVEAALCRVPTIFMALHSQNSPAVLEFAAKGLCRYATSTEAVRQEIQKIIIDADKPVSSQADDPSREYYLGKDFGFATEKIGKLILDRLNRISVVTNQPSSVCPEKEAIL